MVQTTENWNSNDAVISLWHIRAINNGRVWNTVNPLMGTRVVEIVDVLAHQPAQVTLTENDDVIQTFTLDAANETLT